MVPFEEEPITSRYEVVLDLAEEQKRCMSLQEKFVCVPRMQGGFQVDSPGLGDYYEDLGVQDELSRMTEGARLFNLK